VKLKRLKEILDLLAQYALTICISVKKKKEKKGK